MTTGTSEYDPVQAAIDALLTQIDQPDPGTHYVKVGSLDLAGVGSGPQAVAEVGRLIDADAEVICLQHAGPFWSALNGAYADTWVIVAPDEPSTDTRNTPIMLKVGTWRVRKQSALLGDADNHAFIVKAIAVHEETSQKFTILNTAPEIGTDSANVVAYQRHVAALGSQASAVPKRQIGIIAGSWGVDYSQRDTAEAWWPSRVLGGANYAFCYSFFDDDALSALTTDRAEGSARITQGVYGRKGADMAWSGTTSILMQYASSNAVLATYEVAVKEAEEPDPKPDADLPTGVPYGASTFTVASINLRITLGLGSARADFIKVNQVSGGLDIFGLQEMQGIERKDFFGNDQLAAFADIHVQPNRTRSRGCDANPVGWRRDRFEYVQGSGKAVLLTRKFYYETDGDRAGLMYATEARCRDRVSGRYVTIWSIHTPPHVEDHASGLPRDMPLRIPVLLDCMAAVKMRALRVPAEELFIVVGDLNWDAFRNVWPQRPNEWFRQAGMTTVWQALGKKAPGTLGDRWVDYIVMSNRSWAKFVSAGITTGVYTDHNPPYAEIQIQPA